MNTSSQLFSPIAPAHRLLDKVELSVDDSWVHQLRLSACPDRAARLLMNARSDAAPAGPRCGLGAAQPARHCCLRATVQLPPQ